MRKITCILALFAAYVLTSSPALAATHVPGRVSFSQSSYWAHENQGFVNITIRRTNPRVDEWIRYGVRQASALNGKDFDAIPNSLAHFAPGQSTYTFKVHIYDRGIVGPKLRAVAYMYGSYPQRMVAPHQDNIYPHLVLYLDGGAADAAPWRAEARMLNKAGVHDAQGFFLNATHFDWTTKELYYGQRIARALGGVHFVINTGENGRGPLIPPNPSQQGNEVLCNPPGRGLGPLTVDTGYKWADGFLWFSNPGGSGGPRRPGAPATAHYWPAYAVMLVRNAVYRVTGPSYPLVHDPGSSDTAPTLPGNGANPVQPLHLSMQ